MHIKTSKPVALAVTALLALAACSSTQSPVVQTPTDIPSSVAVSPVPSVSPSVYTGDTPPTPSPLDKATEGKYAPKGMPKPKGKSSPSTNTTAALKTNTLTYSYVAAQQTPSSNVDGAYGNFYMATPQFDTAVNGTHTLQEISVQSADSHQVIEVGVTSDHSVNGDNFPHVFVFSWIWDPTNPTADGGRCYNGCGWVDYAPNSFDAGAAIPAGVDIHTYKSIGIKHFNNAWWIQYNHKWMGYFPDADWNSTSCGCTFTHGNFVQWFGEVAYVSNTGETRSCTDMGTGVQGSLGRTASPIPSSINSMGYYGLPTSAVNVTSLVQSAPIAYSGHIEDPRSISDGGPGWDATDTVAGTRTDC